MSGPSETWAMAARITAAHKSDYLINRVRERLCPMTRSRADEAATKLLADRPPRSMHDVFGDVTQEEWEALVWHLAEIRTRKLIEHLIPRRIERIQE